MEKIRFAIIGTNFITDVFLEAAFQCERFVLQAVYSRTMKRAKEFASKYNAPLTFDDLDKLADCTEVDAVYIASPTGCHYRQSLIMLRAGKHVLCEKPATANSHELEQLLNIADQKKCIYLEAMRMMYTPGYAFIKKTIPELGDIRLATLNFCKYSSRYDDFKRGIVRNAFKKDLANGAIMDIGVYGIHMMVDLFGVPYSFTAKGNILPGSIDGAGIVVGKYRNMQAEVVYSKITNSYLPCEIQGEKGNIVFSTLADPERIKLFYRNGEKKEIHVETVHPNLYYECEAFMDYIQGKRKDLSEMNQISVKTMRLMDDARKQMDIVFPNDF